MENPDLTGHAILIVDNEISLFADTLQRQIDATGAQSVAIRRPEEPLPGRTRRMKFTAAVVASEHAERASSLGIPLLVYGTPELPARPRAIVEALVRLLKG